ncbi:MAG: coenzyme F420-0:L-glutamate ligase [Dehalococcoidia bacterium]|nr:coenzyme F420-0:L-glutamate ligase [Dehalococcoidia bacterium]
MAVELRVAGLTSLPEVRPGDDLARLIFDAAEREGVGLQDGDVVSVTQKIVSKAEGRLVDLREVEPSDFARQVAAQAEKDPRVVEVVLRETKRVVRMDKGVLVVETHGGFVCANAGVDNSNIPGSDIVSLLPADPDASAARLRAAFRTLAGVETAVIITDSFGRPWREGTTEIAIGVAGMLPVESYRGRADRFGNLLRTTEIAVADQLAAAAGAVTEKLSGVPVVVLRGAAYPAGEGTGKALLRPPDRDMFR